MPLSTIQLHDHDATHVDFTLIGQTSAGGEYRVVTRALAAPMSLQFNYKIGPTNSKASDKLVVSLRDVRINTDTNQAFLNQCRLETTVSRDSQNPATEVEDLLALLGDLLSNANFRAEIADGMLPSTAQS